MKKFRNWFFKLLTGYDLLEYEDILRYAAKVNKSSQEVLELTASIHDDNKKILELNGRIIEANQRALETSNKTIEHCRSVLLLCQEVKANETLD